MIDERENGRPRPRPRPGRREIKGGREEHKENEMCTISLRTPAVKIELRPLYVSKQAQGRLSSYFKW